MLTKTKLIAACSIATLTLAAGCSDNNNSPNAVVGPATAPFQEIIDQGVTRYLGVYSPMMSETDGEVVNHSFGGGDGPLCLDGSEFSMATRDTGSDELVIFLQGGGACWSTLCAATTSAGKGIPKAGILDPDEPGNPVASWNTVYVPYCDGGLHASDADNDYDGDGQPETLQRGLHNLSASLDVAVNTFPAPKRILLTGSSAGGFGTIYALPLVRALYPDVPIELINDSGVGVSRPDEPEFTELLQSDWNAEAFFPASCDNCIGEDGHLTDYHKWQLEQDDNFRLSLMSYKQDAVIAVTFSQVGGEVFEEALLEEMADLKAAYPERVNTFIVNGSSHTFLQSDLAVTADGVTVLDWVTAMLDGSADWVTVIDPEAI
jgi:hypothetical protein